MLQNAVVLWWHTEKMFSFWGHSFRSLLLLPCFKLVLLLSPYTSNIFNYIFIITVHSCCAFVCSCRWRSLLWAMRRRKRNYRKWCLRSPVLQQLVVHVFLFETGHGLKKKNNNRIPRRNSRFCTISSLNRELSPIRTLKWPGRDRVQITCNTSSAYHVQHVVLCATWYKGTAQLLCLTECEWHLF